MTTPKFTIIEVYCKFDATENGSQQTRLMCVESGRFFSVVTSPLENGQGWSSTFVWCWPRVNGLAHTWLLGDSMHGKDHKPWVRVDPNTSKDQIGIPDAHYDAVKHITALAANGYVDWSTASYSSKAIPSLFSDPTLPPKQYATLKTKATDPIQEINDLISSLKIKELTPTQDDMNAIHSMNPNYALGA